MKIAVTRRLFPDQITRLRDKYEVEMWDSDLPPEADELLRLLDGAGAALTLLTDRIDAELLDKLPQLRVVSNLAVGFDNIDVDAATARRVAVCTTPDVLTDSTAEFTIALIFAAARQVGASDRAARDGQWHTWYPMKFLGVDLIGKTLGVVGYGRIGQRVADLAAGIGMRVIVSDPRTINSAFESVSLDHLLSESDVVSLHAPLNADTRQMMNRERLGKMKQDAILINTARGGVIDTDALVSALEDGKFQAVALDVTDPEPLPADHRLYQFDNVTITPHIASATIATRREMTRLAVDNLIAVLERNDPPHCLNPEVLPLD